MHHSQCILVFVLLIAVQTLTLACAQRIIAPTETKKSTECIALYQSDDWTVRKTAVQKISKFNDKESTDLLITATADSHAPVVIEALRGLRRFKPPEALSRVAELAEKSPHPNIRWHAIRTLGYYREPTAAIIFAKGLNDDDWLIREESIKGLLKITDYSIRFISIPYILQALEDPSPNVKIATLKYLRIKDPRIYLKLSKMLSDAKDHQQTLIEETLKALKGYELDDSTKEKVVYFITHQNQDIRLAAYHALISQKHMTKQRKSTTRKKEIVQ